MIQWSKISEWWQETIRNPVVIVALGVMLALLGMHQLARVHGPESSRINEYTAAEDRDDPWTERPVYVGTNSVWGSTGQYNIAIGYSAIGVPSHQHTSGDSHTLYNDAEWDTRGGE